MLYNNVLYECVQVLLVLEKPLLRCWSKPCVTERRRWGVVLRVLGVEQVKPGLRRFLSNGSLQGDV